MGYFSLIINFPQVCSGILRQYGIDIKTGAPLKTSNPRKLRDYFKVPMVMLFNFRKRITRYRTGWFSMDYPVVLVFPERKRQPFHCNTETISQINYLPLSHP